MPIPQTDSGGYELNAKQTILTILNDAEKPMRREGIETLTGYAKQTVVKALADLGQTKSIAQSKGYYTITPVGRKQIEGDKFLTAFTTRGAVAQLKPFEQGLPLKLIEQSDLCQQVLRMKDGFALQDRIHTEFLPFVLMWLAYNKYELPEYNYDKVVHDEDDALRENVLNYVLDNLIFQTNTEE